MFMKNFTYWWAKNVHHDYLNGKFLKSNFSQVTLYACSEYLLQESGFCRSLSETAFKISQLTSRRRKGSEKTEQIRQIFTGYVKLLLTELVHLVIPNNTFLNRSGVFKFTEHTCCVHFKSVTLRNQRTLNWRSINLTEYFLLQ